nr:autotransporter-associated beta strand repeat-containing protein [Salmonella enterica]
MKSGDKTLTLSGINSYTGGTTISGGTLVASNVDAQRHAGAEHRR